MTFLGWFGKLHRSEYLLVCTAQYEMSEMITDSSNEKYLVSGVEVDTPSLI